MPGLTLFTIKSGKIAVVGSGIHIQTNALLPGKPSGAGYALTALPVRGCLWWPLQATRATEGQQTLVTVQADIHGDVRPVQNARVAANGQTVKTDAQGRARLSDVQGAINVSAGETFQPVTLTP